MMRDAQCKSGCYLADFLLDDVWRVEKINLGVSNRAAHLVLTMTLEKKEDASQAHTPVRPGTILFIKWARTL